MLTDDTITRTQTLTVPTYTPPLPRCGALLTLDGDCPIHGKERRLLWRGIGYGVAGSGVLWGLLLGGLGWLGRVL
jgi:hypothetical protein